MQRGPPQLQERYRDADFIARFRYAFRAGQSYCDGDGNGDTITGVHVEHGSFPVGRVHAPFDDVFMRDVRDAVTRQPFFRKHNDLYEFLQSEDLQCGGRRSGEDLQCGAGGRHIGDGSDNAADSASAELGGIDHERESVLARFRDAVASDTFVEWMSALTGIELVGTGRKCNNSGLRAGRAIDLAAQRYLHGHRLLCHDDDIMAETAATIPVSTASTETVTASATATDTIADGGALPAVGRRIAFIWYLVDDAWNNADGGRLELFGVYDRNVIVVATLCTSCLFLFFIINAAISIDLHRDSRTRLPTIDILTAVIPCWNTLAFFEVTPTSFHQVSEVLAQDKERLSITGWLYGPLAPEHLAAHRPKEAYAPIPSVRHQLPSIVQEEHVDAQMLEQCSRWIRAEYLEAKAIQSVGNFFLENSFVELQDVLRADVYQELLSELKSVFNEDGQSNLRVELMAPPNVHRYRRAVAATGDRASHANELSTFIVSSDFQRLVRAWTNTEWTCALGGEYRHFHLGDYTLLHDFREKLGETLELMMDFSSAASCVPAQSTISGGDIVYVEGEEELLRIRPRGNKLTLVYRESEEAMSFVEYVARGSQPRMDFFVQWTNM